MPLQMSQRCLSGVLGFVIPYLIRVSLQAQDFPPGAQLPDPHGHVVGGGNQEIGCHGMEADGVNLFRVTW